MVGAFVVPTPEPTRTRHHEAPDELMAEDKKHDAGSFRVIKLSRAGYDAMIGLELAAVLVGEARTPEEIGDAYAGLNKMRERLAFHLSRVEQMAIEGGALGIAPVATVRYR